MAQMTPHEVHYPHRPDRDRQKMITLLLYIVAAAVIGTLVLTTAS
jgi:hypothetical protein